MEKKFPTLANSHIKLVYSIHLPVHNPNLAIIIIRNQNQSRHLLNVLHCSFAADAGCGAEIEEAKD